MKELQKLTKDLTVLYVEDNEEIIKKMMEMFERLFKKVVRAFNGKKGLEYIKNNNFDLIITDINMPEMDGLEMIKNIRKLEDNGKNSIPIIIFSAYDNSETLIKAIEYGTDGFIGKPMDLKILKINLEKVAKNLLLKKENIEYKNNLENKIKKQMKEIKEKTLIAEQQAKFAEMGAMIDMIAHQWKQPLNVISMYLSILEFNFEDMQEYIEGGFDDSEIEKGIKTIREQITHLVETLDEFRNFFRPSENKKVEKIKLSLILKSVKVLLKDMLIKYRITLEENYSDNMELIVNPNEFKHIFINLISNAKDIFELMDIKDRVIYIEAKKEENKTIISVKDNGSGIQDEFIDKIFDANFTTKELMNGTGMGLYMSKLIAKKYGGDLIAKNWEKGAEFILTI
jgi:signal transduction histidine kinase